MTCKWIICGNHLAIEDQDEILHPSSDEIYALEDGGVVEGITIENPREALPEIRFSHIGSSVQCSVFSDPDGKICLQVSTIRRKKEIPVDVIDGTVLDHCLYDNEWFYLTGDCEALSEILSGAGILCNGEISVQQYLYIRKIENSEHTGLFTFDVNEVQIKDAVPVENTVPKKLKATLYNYQKIGFSWMHYMIKDTGGCILGDEMGLGKTLQVITLFLRMLNEKTAPMLVVAPVSLLENWRQECKKFAPSIKTYIHHGARRTGFYADLLKYDVVIISYNTAVSDLSMLRMIEWELVVLDEAQNIKNPYSERSKSVRALPRKGSIAVSGTPFENHILDVWSLMDFVIPGLLGEISTFKQIFTDDEDGARRIEPILTPVMLRRLVKDVANDLPEKVIIPQPLDMLQDEADEYERIRADILQNNPDQSTISLAAIQKLRMFCTYPSICTGETYGDPAQASLKYQRFCELMEEIVACNEKVLIFTSYKRMFDVFNDDIPRRFNVPIWNINGETPVEERQTIVDTFNKTEGVAVLVLNPRAAGTGLNITGANHVIHFNLEWNPALEDQASARAYRRGQEKTVFIYRLFYRNTVEELVNERLERKRELAKTLVVGNIGENQDRQDIISAINMSPVSKERND